VGHNVPSLAKLLEAHGEGWRAFVGSAEHGESWVAPGVSVGIAGEPSHNLNWIVCYGPEGVREGIAAAARVLRRRRLPALVFAASPVAPEAAATASELGLVYAGRIPVMCAHASAVVRADGGHWTRRVTDVEGVQVAGEVLGDAFELPAEWCQRILGVRFGARDDAFAFLALHDGRPVAVAGSAQIGDIAGIYAVGTRRTHRRRGAGSAAASAAIDHHLESGAHWFGVLAAPNAEPFYAGLGFVAVDHASTWVLETA